MDTWMILDVFVNEVLTLSPMFFLFFFWGGRQGENLREFFQNLVPASYLAVLIGLKSCHLIFKVPSSKPCGKWKWTDHFAKVSGKEPSQTCFLNITFSKSMSKHVHENDGSSLHPWWNSFVGYPQLRVPPCRTNDMQQIFEMMLSMLQLAETNMYNVSDVGNW